MLRLLKVSPRNTDVVPSKVVALIRATVPAGFNERTVSAATFGSENACAITDCGTSLLQVAKRGFSALSTLALSGTLTVYGVAVPHACSEVSVAPPDDEEKYAVIGRPL